MWYHDVGYTGGFVTDPLILVNLKLIYSLSPSQICKAIEVLLHCTLKILMQCNVM